jgi:hypothetical protein
MWIFNSAVGALMIVMYYQAKARGETGWMVGFAVIGFLNFTFAYLGLFY